MIKLNNLTKRYGNFTAVDNISINVDAGQIYSFLGVNGAGKTTTIKMITGVLLPTSGEIRICGEDLIKNPQKAKSLIGYISDRPYLYNKLTGYEFLLFCADLYNLNSNFAKHRARELLIEYGLKDWQNQLIESYSHGMKQRLAMSAALIHDPKVLVIDEPMVGLDPHGAKMFKESLKKYAKEGKSIFLSTHSLNVAEELSDYVTIIQSGKLLVSGTVKEIMTLAGKHDSQLEQAFIALTSSAYSQN